MGPCGVQGVLSDTKSCDGPNWCTTRIIATLVLMRWADMVCKKSCKIRGRALARCVVQGGLSD